ncbi:hypothetical protein CDL15_Pgr028292 [Punica granatum]|uniref:Uncharacterized protein n=1 Tax=Punica granatum TaxID=22663 RepID=A0A218VXV4_PUNGR|nr:hypothetical protein CDL15_Pgr028292 [Punica granatum]
MSPLRRRCPLGLHAHRDEVASSVLCPWGGGVFDLSEAGFAARAIACWGCPGRAMRDSSSRVERLRIPRGRKSESAVVLAVVVPVILTSLVSHGITSDFFGSPGRPVESFCLGDACGGPAFGGPDVRPPGFLLALDGHIETFSKVPKRLYRLFDAPVSLGPFSSGCRRAAAFVTRMGNFFVQIWSDLSLLISRVL